MLSRILVAIPLVGIIFFTTLFGNYSTLILVEIISLFSLNEFYNMTSKKYVISKNMGMILGALIPVLVFFRDDIQYVLYFVRIKNTFNPAFDMGTFIILAMFILVIKQVLFKEIKNSLMDLTFTLFGIIYIPYLLSHLLLMKELPFGNYIMLYTFLGIWCCDTGAYFVGILFGRKIFKKGLSSLSPKKSIEGAIGGIVAVIILTANYNNIIILINKIFNISVHYTDKIIFNTNYTRIIILAILISIFATLGDLVESKFKRECEIKDSSNILLGHGGFLDRFDSALFVIPIVYYFIKFFIL